MKKTMTALFLVLLLFMGGCVGGQSNIKFGLGSLEDGITEAKSTFSQDESFLMEVHLSEPFGATSYRYVILEKGDGYETIFEEGEDSVEPSWDWMIYEFHNPMHDGEFDSGEYILRLYNADPSVLLAEGEFSIQ